MKEGVTDSLASALQEAHSSLTSSLEEYGTLQERIVQQIREYSKLQAPLWKQIPNLALEADGRSGYGDNRALMYEDEVMRVMPERGNYLAAIDLRTGEILSFSHGYSEGRTYVVIHSPTPDSVETISVDGIDTDVQLPGDEGSTEIIGDEDSFGKDSIRDILVKSPDEIVLRFVNNLDLLDAQAEIESLKGLARQDYFYAYKPQEIEAWRAEIRQRKGWSTLSSDDLKPASGISESQEKQISRTQLQARRGERMHPE